jgi:hypothetical protein
LWEIERFETPYYAQHVPDAFYVQRNIVPITLEIPPSRISWANKQAIRSPDGTYFFPDYFVERDSEEAAIKYLTEAIAAEQLAAKETEAKPAPTLNDLLQGYQRRPGLP